MMALSESKHMSSLDIEFEMTLYAVLVSIDQTKDSGIRECKIDPFKDIVFSDGKWFVRIDLNGFTWPLYIDYGFYVTSLGYPHLMHSNDNQDYISWRLLRSLIEFEDERVNTPKKQKAIKTYLMRDNTTG